MPIATLDPQSGERYWNEAVANNPASPTAWCGLAAVLAETERPDDALLALREAERLAPDSADVQRELGLLLQQRGDLNAAIQAFERALAHCPQDPPMLYHLGSAYLAVGLYPNAADALLLASELLRESPAVWGKLGSL